MLTNGSVPQGPDIHQPKRHRSHEVITIEHGGGYAAQCKTCGDMTPGGFPTRDEARAQIIHEEPDGTVWKNPKPSNPGRTDWSPAGAHETESVVATRNWLQLHAEAVSKVQPRWADATLTRVVTSPHDGDSVRFACVVDAYEVSQWADHLDGALNLVGDPYLQVQLTDVELDAMTLTEAAQEGIRVAQFIAAAEGRVTDVSNITLSDLSKLAKMDGVTADVKMAEFIASGALSLPEEAGA